MSIIRAMPTFSELVLSLISDQPLSNGEKWEVARHILRLMRRGHEAQRLSDERGRDFRDN
jgi:hypothetical protein